MCIADEFSEDKALVLGSEIEIECPYCSEIQYSSADSGGASSQCYIEDCQVCCKPMQIYLEQGEDGEWIVTATKEN